jgi:hypothetical protein
MRNIMNKCTWLIAMLCAGAAQAELSMPTAPMRMGVRSRENLATGLYNGMIAPLAPFAISGAIWYQGESNGSEGGAYTHKMRALIEGWLQSVQQSRPTRIAVHNRRSLEVVLTSIQVTQSG